jgi:predicted Zn-dependent peptidase
VNQKQLAVYAGSFPLDLEDPGVFIMYAIGNAGVDPKDLELNMDSIINRAQINLPEEDEFSKVQNQAENDFVTANNRVVGIAESLANYEMFYGDANLINTELERYRKVTREDIKRVASKFLHPNHRVVLYYLPEVTP